MKTFLTIDDEKRVSASLSGFNVRKLRILAPTIPHLPDLEFYESRHTISEVLETIIADREISGVSIDGTLCFSQGRMVMNISSAQYQSLGIDGRKCGSRRIIEIDMVRISAGHLLRAKKGLSLLTGHHRIYSTKDMESRRHTMIPRIVSKRCQVPRITELFKMPMSGDRMDWYTELQNDIMNHLAWMSLNAIGNVDPYISVYAPPPSRNEEIQVLTYEGYIPGSKVLELMTFFNSEWSAFLINGFEDAPEAWSGIDHIPGEECNITFLKTSFGIVLWECMGKDCVS